MKRVVSVSLGAAARDFTVKTTLLGCEVEICRQGTDGDVARAKQLMRALDAGRGGAVDAVGLGGLDLYFFVGERRYTLQQGKRLADAAPHLRVVCGAGLKRVLEPQIVYNLNSKLPLKGRRVLMVSAVDRYFMAQAFAGCGAKVAYGDLAFALGVPYFLRTEAQLKRAAGLLLPAMTQLPIAALYPTGKKQDKARRTPPWLAKELRATDIIAGDWHFIRRYLPEDLAGKIILSNTTTPENAQLLAARGAAALYTTTPRIDGRSLPTNALEAAFIAVTEGAATVPEGLAAAVKEAGLQGSFTAF